MTLQRACCRVCGDIYAVTATGRMVSHQGRGTVATCAGSAREVTPRQLVDGPPPPAPTQAASTLDGLPGADRFAFDPLRGVARCGFCGELQSWRGQAGAALAKGLLTLTGEWGLAVDDEASGRLVVAIAAQPTSGAVIWLPHVCPLIPEAALETAVRNGQ